MNVLAISPHTDDAEMGAGGTMFKLRQEGHAVTHLALSTGMTGAGSNLDEFRAAAEVLGVTWRLEGYECRKFALQAHNIRNLFVQWSRNDKPDLVLVPSSASAHEDHEVVTAEARRAFRTCCLIGYETPWSDLRPFKADLYVELTEQQYMKKIEAVTRYESQLKSRHYFRYGTLGINNRLRGLQIKVESGYAEAFEVFRWILR